MKQEKEKYEKQVSFINQGLVDGFLDTLGELEGYIISDYELGNLLGKLFFVLNHYEVLEDG